MTKKVRRDVEDRAAEYVDSALMTQRLRNGRQLSARIEGHYGVYRTSLRLGTLADSSCTCPSEAWPCKHIRALRLTWERNPKSFFNLVDFLKELSARSKPELVDTIGKMVMVAPECLNVCGVEGFEPKRADDDYEAYDEL